MPGAAPWPGSASTCPLPPEQPRILALVGATSVGKTRLALELAEHLPLEVVSADSRTVYRGMDIGTAKPTPAEQAQVRHHLLDVVEPDEPYSLAHYQSQALQAIADITARGKLPVLVGGAGLYVSAVCNGLIIPEVPPDLAFRQNLEDRAQREGWQSLQPDLLAVDPASAARIDPKNVRRVIRALEVSHATGRPFSAWQIPQDPPPVQALRVGLRLDRPTLWQRIDDRIDAWLSGGLLDEVGDLLARGYSPTLPSMSSIGYREIAAYLAGSLALDDARVQMKQATHQYAKRQMTWFRREQHMTWLDAATTRAADVIASLRQAALGVG
jgi:tRNA dimethylallyltransferase